MFEAEPKPESPSEPATGIRMRSGIRSGMRSLAEAKIEAEARSRRSGRVRTNSGWSEGSGGVGSWAGVGLSVDKAGISLFFRCVSLRLVASRCVSLLFAIVLGWNRQPPRSTA